MTDHNLHLGLDFAQYRENVDPDATDVDLIIRWAKEMIKAYDIAMDTPDYESLIRAVEGKADEAKVLDDIGDRQRYFQEVFLAVIEQQKATADNDKTVYPVHFPNPEQHVE